MNLIVLVVFYCVPALISLAGFTHIAFWQNRRDSLAINTLGEYALHVAFSLCPILNWVSTYFITVEIGKRPLRKFNR